MTYGEDHDNPKKRKRKAKSERNGIGEHVYRDFKSMYFGRQVVKRIELLQVDVEKAEDGYYQRIEGLLVNGGEGEDEETERKRRRVE